ncbi:Major facilitator superfamily domain general substrate transporter [Penicillium taxi]|uniref:Major facilitator superfamily domain general substrate transporter n=1 Tax=Penicillium taxi TaxID=168475 RepID=UPI0025459B5A|nr:Major facilitator superfamily domain general substrate transporter [Penicillium taxi]KAJ5899414.1 Major facilitator superfamily domain general substrate transporter [Penicillium taxi]
MFLIFRFIAGSAASGPMSIGGGTVADVTLQENRGKAMALFTMGPILGPILGPFIGGFVSRYLGWCWTFRIILILSGIITAATFALMRETNATILLSRKLKQLQKETGNPDLVAARASNLTTKQMLLRAIVRPLKLLIFSPIVLLISLYTGLMLGISGIAYLGLGIGMFSGLVLFSVLSDKLLSQKQGGAVAAPEQRLILMKWFGPITPFGCFMYGWSAYYHRHWIVPIIRTSIIGLGCLLVVIPGQICLVDSFGAAAAASSIAANLLVRSPFGAFLDLTATPLYNKLGLGSGNSVLGFITLALTSVPWLFYHYRGYLRTKFAVDL